MKNFSKIPFFLSILLFMLSLLAFVFFYREINKNNEETQKREREWQIETKRREDIKILNNSVKKIEAEKIQLETHFAQSSDIVPFLDTIEGLAPKVGIKAEVTSVDIAQDHKGLIIGMKASGTFSGLYRFLTLLENSPYELEFIGMNMNKETAPGIDGQNSPSSEWSAVFNIKLLSFIE